LPASCHGENQSLELWQNSGLDEIEGAIDDNPGALSDSWQRL
jgi:hypothetical protein